MDQSRCFYRTGGLWVEFLQENNTKDGEEKLRTKILRISDKLEKFRYLRLETTELKQWENEIQECYQEIRKVVGPTSASKTLHIICPSFFPLWDDNIRCLTGVTTKPTGYYNFMRKSQDFIKNNNKTTTELSKKYRKSKLKIVDEYLYNISRKKGKAF